VRGEYAHAQETAETFLREAEAEGRATEAGAARRMLGFILMFQSDFKGARSVLEQALADYDPERDGETQLRFSRDTEVCSASYLALAEWHLGKVVVSRQSIERANRRAEELGYAAARANALFWKTILESRRDDPSAVRVVADSVVELAEEYNIKTYAELSRMYAHWARGRLLDPEAGARDLSGALAASIAQDFKCDMPSFCGLLAELEVSTRGPERALERIDEGLAIANETGEHLTDAYLHRLRGDILLKRDPVRPAAAEHAYQTAIDIAKHQGARSYELLASLALAKLYQSTTRAADALAVLAPALEGFSPTQEMPEIAEAQTLLEQLGAAGRAQ
jgi:adenylate cyclase